MVSLQPLYLKLMHLTLVRSSSIPSLLSFSMNLCATRLYETSKCTSGSTISFTFFCAHIQNQLLTGRIQIFIFIFSKQKTVFVSLEIFWYDLRLKRPELILLVTVVVSVTEDCNLEMHKESGWEIEEA